MIRFFVNNLNKSRVTLNCINNNVTCNNNNNNNKNIDKIFEKNEIKVKLYSTNNNSPSSLFLNNNNNNNNNSNNNNNNNNNNEDIKNNINFLNYFNNNIINNSEIREEISIINLIEKEPNNINHYYKLIEINNDPSFYKKVFKINGIDMNMIDLHLKVIDLDDSFKNIHYNLYLLNESLLNNQINSNNNNSIKLLNGKELKPIDLLIKEFYNDNQHFESLLKISYYLKDFIQDKISLPISKDQWREVNKLSILQKVLDLKKAHPIAISQIIYFMKTTKLLNEFQLLNGESYTMKQLALMSYVENKDSQLIIDQTWLDMIECLERGSGSISNKKLGIEIKPIALILEAISKFPNNSLFYYHLSNHLLNNFETVNLNNINNTIIGGSKKKKLNRLDLIKIAILLQQDKINENSVQLLLMSDYYYSAGKFLDTRYHTIELNGIQFNNVDLLIKSLEIEMKFIFSVSSKCVIEDLIKLLNHNEIIKINGQSITKEGIIHLLLGPNSPKDNSYYNLSTFAFSKLIEHYENQIKINNINNIQEQQQQQQQKQNDNELLRNKINHFSELLIKSKEILKLGGIEILKLNPNISDNYYYLSTYLDYDETITIDGQEWRKTDLILKSIELDPTRKLSHYSLFEYLLLPSSIENNKLAVQLIDGTVLEKHQLLYFEIINNPNFSNAYYHFGLHLKENNFNELAIQIFNRCITIDPKFSKAYLELGILLHDLKIEDTEIKDQLTNETIIKLSRKQLFIKALELENQNNPLNPSNSLSWYYLSLEMNSDNNNNEYGDSNNNNNNNNNNENDGHGEIQFGKTKKEILSLIIKNDPTFSKPYYQLSNVLKSNKDKCKVTGLNRIELLLKSIEFESDLQLKSLYLSQLSKYLQQPNQHNDKIILNDGRIMNKQQLLINAIEINPQGNISSLYIDLSNTLSNKSGGNQDVVLLFDKQFNKNDLLNASIENLNQQNDPNYIYSLKIKSNYYLNLIKSLIK
ncbi:hypothetical protein RB653_002044 [Dictyostelium firmibasis]|uniref:Uncharacterized protein n=1 Tax=Dictyostelium firmibasis TaxID=79012 RepID=A0AAN7TW60_9MYCE